MQLQSKSFYRRYGARRGLAPLELVLSLPMMMIMMAAMVSFGTAACWKVRAHLAARHAVWKTRWPRTGQLEPPPRDWPLGALMQAGDAPALSMLDLPALNQPVVRGPIPGGFRVNERLLNESRGARQGYSEIQRSLAMLPKMRPYRLAVQHPILDDRFSYLEMGIPFNRFRRLPFIYELPKADASLSQAYANAVNDTVTANSRQEIFPLDRDEELREFYGSYIDFHPRLGQFCQLDRESVRRNQVEPLVNRIRGGGQPRVAGVPERMTQTFLQMYEELKRRMEQNNGAAHAPATANPLAFARAPNQILAMYADTSLSDLDAKIQQLRAFLSRLRKALSSDRGNGDGKPQMPADGPGDAGGRDAGGDGPKAKRPDGDGKGGRDGDDGEKPPRDGGKKDRPDRPDDDGGDAQGDGGKGDKKDGGPKDSGPGDKPDSKEGGETGSDGDQGDKGNGGDGDRPPEERPGDDGLREGE